MNTETPSAPSHTPHCLTCGDEGIVFYRSGQTAESYEEGSHPCPDCNSARPLLVYTASWPKICTFCANGDHLSCEGQDINEVQCGCHCALAEFSRTKSRAELRKSRGLDEPKAEPSSERPTETEVVNRHWMKVHFDLSQELQRLREENQTLSKTVASLREVADRLAVGLEWTLTCAPSPCRCMSFATPPYVCERHLALAEYEALSAAPASDWVRRSELDRLNNEIEAVQRIIRDNLSDDVISGSPPAECVAILASQRDNCENDISCLRAKLAAAEAERDSLKAQLLAVYKERDEITQKTREECGNAAGDAVKIMLDTLIEPQMVTRDKEIHALKEQCDRMKDRLGKIATEIEDSKHLATTFQNIVRLFQRLEKWASEGLGE